MFLCCYLMKTCPELNLFILEVQVKTVKLHLIDFVLSKTTKSSCNESESLFSYKIIEKRAKYYRQSSHISF